MPDPVVLTNAWVVTRDRLCFGSVELLDDRIVAVYRGATSLPGAIDWQGDYLLPGLIELHSRHLDRCLSVADGAGWPLVTAVLAHDAQMIAAGFTSAYAAVDLDAGEADGTGAGNACLALARALRQAEQNGFSRCRHRLNLHCRLDGKVSAERFAEIVADPFIGLVSLVRAPGSGVGTGSPQMGSIAALCRQRGLPLASDGAASTADLEAAEQVGGILCESPADGLVQRRARALGLRVMLTAAGSLAADADSELDILSSDDYPPALVQAAFRLHRAPIRMPLPDAVATVSARPAETVGLFDCGEIAPGKRADLVRVRCSQEVPVVREVWRGGARVF